MVDRGPDLIARAADRLRRAPEQADGPNQTKRDSHRVPFQPPIGLGPSGQHEVRSNESKAGRVLKDAVSISQTSLAAQAIVLPSSGSSRTVEEFRALKREILGNISRNRGS